LKGNKDKEAFRTTKEWKAFSKRLRAERPYCECCKTPSKRLQVHHMDESLEHYTDISDPSKFAVLCSHCHKAVEHLARIKRENWCKYDALWVECYSRFIIKEEDNNGK